MISTLFYDVAVPVTALLVLIGIFRVLWWLFIGRFERKATHKSGAHTWPATFQGSSTTPALPALIDLSGGGRGNSRSATPSAVVPAPAGQPPRTPHGPVPYYAAVAWQAAGVNGRAHNWTPRTEATTSWDVPLSRDLQNLLQAESVDTWLDAHFGPAMASARKAIGT